MLTCHCLVESFTRPCISKVDLIKCPVSVLISFSIVLLIEMTIKVTIVIEVKIKFKSS